MDLVFEARCMPNLEKLDISFRGAVENESLSSPGAFHFGIENLSSLITFRCELDYWAGIRTSTVDAVKASVEIAVSTHPNNHLIEVKPCIHVRTLFLL